jgi:integrase
MTANLQVKNDRYYAVVNYKQNGKYKQKWIALGLPVKNNKRKAEAMLPAILAKFESDILGPTADTLLTDYAMVWLRKKAERLSPTTRYSYERAIKNHIIKYFEPMNLKLKEVRPKHVQDYLEYQTTHGKRGGGKMSWSLTKKVKYYLYAMLQDAVAQEIINRNPAEGVKPPSLKREDKPKRCFLTAEQANKLLESLAGSEIYPIVYITLLYGLRRSEVLGLQWKSIDFKKDTLSLNHVVVVTTKVVEKDDMKTRASNHVYRLLPNAKKVLMEEYEKYLEKRRSPIFEDKGYVFCSADGNALHPQKVVRMFARALEECGFPKMRFHDLRHSTASILYDKGWGLKDIQAWLRHSCISVTSDIYTHITDTRESQIASNINDILPFTKEVKE